jgi:hypothetical protein
LNTFGLIKQTLLCSLLAATPTLAGCEIARFNWGEKTENTDECRVMQDKLTNDQTLTPDQAAEITKNMENAECGRRVPGP